MDCDILIYTGWSNVGGSTESFINLTNTLNDVGITTMMFGPHPYHKDHCNGCLSNEFMKYTHNAKTIIWHFIDPPSKEQIGFTGKYITSCHETNIWNPFKYDVDHYHLVSNKQLQYHIDVGNVSSDDKCTIIPNIIDPNLKSLYVGRIGKIGGVVGSIDRNKNVHISIQLALDDGCDKVLVFGVVTDEKYVSEIKQLFDDPRVEYMGFVNDKSKMYSQITDVYHYSCSETWGFIKVECEYLGIPFHSNNQCPSEYKSKDEIINNWIKIL